MGYWRILHRSASADESRVSPSGWAVGHRPTIVASRVGFEPTTKGLKVPCSTAELPARGKGYKTVRADSDDEVVEDRDA